MEKIETDGNSNHEFEKFSLNFSHAQIMTVLRPLLTMQFLIFYWERKLRQLFDSLSVLSFQGFKTGNGSWNWSVLALWLNFLSSQPIATETTNYLFKS